VTGQHQDCFGMTPLHILACSTKHDLELYQLLIENYSETIITKDIWGEFPICYALWGNAPQEVVQFLVNSQKTLFPHHALDWAAMVETMGRASYAPGRASASLACIKNLLNTQQAAFPDYRVNWQKVVTEWAIEDAGRTKESNTQRFHHDTFKCLIKFSVIERLNSLKIEKLREEILSDIDTLRWFVRYRKESTETIYSKLAHYEQLSELKEATSLLELALWKASIDRSMFDCDQESESSRMKAEIEEFTDKECCRIKCGADIVVANVLPYLLPPNHGTSHDRFY